MFHFVAMLVPWDLWDGYAQEYEIEVETSLRQATDTVSMIVKRKVLQKSGNAYTLILW